MTEQTESIKLSHRIEYGLLVLFINAMKVLGLQRASRVGGLLGRVIGYRVGVTKRARKNLQMAFPEKRQDEIEEILLEMWDNLGRTLAEYPFLGELDFYGDDERVRVHGAEILDSVLKDGQPVILFSGHIGNWEVAPLTVHQKGYPMGIVFRAPNNPLVDELLQRFRMHSADFQIPKGTRGAREILRLLKDKVPIAMLVDQKMNDGVAVPFFGRDAMTAPAAVQIALKQGLKLVPARCIRREGVNFDVYFYPPLEVADTGDIQADVLAGLIQVNTQLEDWIREFPGQWMWVHNRWPKS